MGYRAVTTLVVSFILLLTGCAASGGTLKKQGGYKQQVRSVLVHVKTDRLPPDFVSAYTARLDTLLKARSVDAAIQTFSEMDLGPPADADHAAYDYSLVVAPTHLKVQQGFFSETLKNVILNCTLVEVGSKDVVMKANIEAYVAFGWELGADEGEAAAQKLVELMTRAKLLPPRTN